MDNLQKLNNKISKFYPQCGDTAKITEYEDGEDGLIIYEIEIPFSNTQKYPICEIKVHENKIQIWGHHYHPSLFEKAKSFFGSDLRS